MLYTICYAGTKPAHTVLTEIKNVILVERWTKKEKGKDGKNSPYTRHVWESLARFLKSMVRRMRNTHL